MYCHMEGKTKQNSCEIKEAIWKNVASRLSNPVCFHSKDFVVIWLLRREKKVLLMQIKQCGFLLFSFHL